MFLNGFKWTIPHLGLDILDLVVYILVIQSFLLEIQNEIENHLFGVFLN